MHRTILTLTLLCAIVGCEAQYSGEADSVAPAVDDSYSMSTRKSATLGALEGGGGTALDETTFISTVAAEDLDDAATVQRKIIYNATLSVVVEDFDDMDQQITQLITSAGGYKSSVNIDSNTGSRRRGTWVARVPVEGYNQFLDDIANLGVPESIHQQTDDVTTRYIDVEARLEAKQELESRLRDLVAEREGEISDVMEAERELARVRGEIESLEGELRYLANQSALSTVTINIREEQDYEPPQAPSFGGRVASTWAGSLTGLQNFGKGIVLFAVGATPWLAVLFIVLLPFGIFLRGRRKRKTA